MFTRVFLATAALLAVAPCAEAQSTDPTIDARVRATLDQGRADAASSDEGLITGRGDLILLAPRKLFVLRLSATPQRTSNAELAPAGGHADNLVTLEGGIGVATRVADRVDLHADIGVVAVRYGAIRNLDYDAATADVGAGMGWSTRLGLLSAGVEYMPSLIYTRGFGRRQLTQHRLIGGVALVTPVTARVVLNSNVTLDKTWADPSAFDNWGVALDETVVFQLRHDLQLGVGGGVYNRRYPEYFPGLIGTTRRDRGWRASIAASYSPTPTIVVTLSFSHVDNHSTSDVNPYRVDNGGLALRIARRF